MPAFSYNQAGTPPAKGAPLGPWSNSGGGQVVLDAHGCKYWIWQALAKSVDAPIPGITYTDGLNTYPVYPTGVENIGYILMIKDPNASGFFPVTAVFTQTYPAPGTIDAAAVVIGVRIQVRLIATGPVSSGVYVIPSKLVAQMDGYAWNGGPYLMTGYVNFSGTTLTVSTKGCRVTSPSNQVATLPSVAPNAFSGVGSSPAVSSDTVNVSVSCDPNVTVFATMSDATNIANTTNALTLTAASSATGVGVQVFRDGLTTPITLGPSSGTPDGNPAEWQVGASANAAVYNIPLKASYVQTAATVTPGSVQARATITFNYQ
ncbi:hypothetical protein GCM10007863_02250 [Dyella mobilis]|nr:hypothetical protein GCM10007863_02250 [Dyella mobilis]